MGKEKNAGVAIFISDKIDLKIKITRNKEGHYIMIKGSIQEEDITIVNIYAPNIGAPQYIRQILTDIKGEIDSNTIIVGDLTAHSHQCTDHQNKINKETQVLNDTLDEMDLIDIFRIFPSKCRRIHLFLKCTWNILQDRPQLGSQIKPQ